MINDRIGKENQYRKYLINAEPSSSTIVSFRIMDGACHVEISDNENILHNSTYESGKKADEDITITGLGLPSAN